MHFTVQSNFILCREVHVRKELFVICKQLHSFSLFRSKRYLTEQYGEAFFPPAMSLARRTSLGCKP
jgi:hypothetical protein